VPHFRSRFLDQPGPLARTSSPSLVACSWRRPTTLLVVHHSAEPSGNPLTSTRAELSEVFLLGSGGSSPVPVASLRYVPPPLPRWSSPRSNLFPCRVLPSPSFEGLGLHCLSFRGLHDVRYLRPIASLPGLPGFVGGHHAVLSLLLRVLPASQLRFLVASRFSLAGLHRLSSGHSEGQEKARSRRRRTWRGHCRTREEFMGSARDA
jgi:hypothetical protein